ncbi:MAG TPA: GC-type dockerin domain-anchored protein [Phycisphaerales bacterium]|nr:GC-type dockerin domain-anchored protein [Phycisphaerales bacterium]
MPRTRSTRRWSLLFAVLAAAVLPWGATSRAHAQTYLMIPSAPTPDKAGSADGSPGTYTGTPGVMLFNGSDGSLVDPQFISGATSSYPVTIINPFKAIQVGSEIWVTDSGSSALGIPASIHCFTADYEPVLRPHPTYIRSITGGMSIVRGAVVAGSGSAARVLVCNQGTTNGAPGPALISFKTDGTYDSFIPMPWTSTVGPFDCAVLGVNGSDKVLATASIATNNIYAFNLDGTLDTTDFPNGIFHTGGTDGLNSASGICVAPSGPGGASEVWINGTTNGAGPLAVGVYRYAADRALVGYYPVNWTIPGFMKGIYWLDANNVVYTDPVLSGLTSNGNVKKFDPAAPPANESQTLSISGGTPTSGSFTLTFNGQTTAPIAYNATANTVLNALLALDNIGAVLPFIPPFAPQPPNPAWNSAGGLDVRRQSNVQVVGSALPAGSQAINFIQALAASPQPLITVASSSLDNGATVGVVRSQAGSGTPTFLYPTAAAPANSTFVPIPPAMNIPVFNPPTAAFWPNSYSSYATNVGNGINPQYISRLAPGPSVPTNPYGSASVTLSPNQVGVLAGSSTLITVTATPGTTPTSTNLAVAADLSAFGGSASQAFTNTSGNTFTYTLNVPAGQPGGVYNVQLAVTDDQLRTGGGSALFTVIAQPPPNFFAENDPAVPNDTGKAQAQAVTLATASQIVSNPPPAAYRGIWGTSTGTSPTSGLGVTTIDNYRLKTLPRPPGIYLNSLSISGGTDAPIGVGHLGNIRGLSQNAAGIGTTDALVQLTASNSPTIPPSRTSYWYGFGRQEELYYRVTGTTLSTAEYTATFDSQQVFPEAFPTGGQGNPVAGPLTFARGGGNTTPMALCIYDSNLNPIAGTGAGNITTQSITRTLPNGGPYYLAITPSSIANNLPLGADSPSLTFPAMDFPNILLGGSNTSGFSGTNVITSTLDMTVTASNAVQYFLVPSLSQYQYFHVYWYELYVGPQVNPVVTGAASPTPVIASDDPGLAAQAGYSTVLTATVTPGSNPPSTGLAVVANLNALGGPTVQPLADQFNGTFSFTLLVPASLAPGDYNIPITVTDSQGRSNFGSIPLVVLPVPAPGFVVETEPNDTLVAANPATIAPGGGLYGHSTGSSSSPIGEASTNDGFLITTTGAPPGIYRNRLTITSSGAPGHTGTIRGRQQVAGSVNPFDQVSVFQTSSPSTSPARFNQWYSFGRGEQIDYRVSGTGSTTAEYVSTFTRDPVSPISVAGSVASGSVTIQRAPGNSSVLGMWVYDSNLDPIDQFGGQGVAPLTRTFTPGTYYLAVADAATSNNQATPMDSSTLNSPVLGHPDEIANNSPATSLNMDMQLSHAGGVAAATGTKSGAFDIVWYRFSVADNPAAGACCNALGVCAGSTSATCVGTYQGNGTLCSPNPCPPPPSGVCCRGATCNASVPQASCTSAGTAGAAFITSASACNAVENTTTPCCHADFNKTGGISVQDIFDFLNAWFAGSPTAHVGGDGASGTLAVQDIFNFLNLWFAGGC